MRMVYLTEMKTYRGVTEQDSHLPTLEFLEDTASDPFDVVIVPKKEYRAVEKPDYVYVLTITTRGWIPEEENREWWELYQFPMIKGIGDRDVIDYRREVRYAMEDFGNARKVPPPSVAQIAHAIRNRPYSSKKRRFRGRVNWRGIE